MYPRLRRSKVVAAVVGEIVGEGPRGCSKTRVGDEHHILGGESKAVAARGRRRWGGRGGRGGRGRGGGRGGGRRAARAAAPARGAPGQSQLELVRDLRGNVLEADACSWEKKTNLKIMY